MAKKRKKEYSKYVIAADAFGITHFIVANLVLILGETSTLFLSVGTKHPGVTFIFDYLDAPVYQMFKGFVANFRADPVFMFLTAEFIIVASSLIYGLIAYFIFRAVGSLFNV